MNEGPTRKDELLAVSTRANSWRVRASGLAPILLGASLLVGACSQTEPSSQTPDSGPTTAAAQSSSPTAASETPPVPAATAETKSKTVLKHATVVDGDTIEVGGRSIRIIGVDTPERGECGYYAATALTQSLTASGVTLVKSPTTDNKDKYDRLLRFVETSDGRDVGAKLIRAGLANARYDSQDGYDTHKNETKYHRLSGSTAHQCPSLDSSNASSRSTQAPNAVAGSSGKCDPNYGGTCVPLSSRDLDCSDLQGSVTVKGADVHNFDRDGDGFGCESN